MTPLNTKIVWLLFFFSGACGLVYEVIWTHELSLIFGNTVYSLSAVLTSFMGGLALGSYLAGRASKRITRPLRVYGYFEIFIGLYCALLPFLFNGAETLYATIYNTWGTSFYLLSTVRFLISFLILLIPTTFMGATLPILTEALLYRRDALGFTTGNLYAFNAFGAVMGTLGAGFLLIPFLGIQWTIFSTAALNLVLGISAFALDSKLGETKILFEEVREKRPKKRKVKKTQNKSISISSAAVFTSVLVFGVSGFAAMVSQVAWTRVFSLAVGSTIYAFSIIVAAFILGLAIGSSIGARKVDNRRDLVKTLALVQLGLGTSCMIILPVLGWSPLLFVKLILKYAESFNLLLTLEFLAVAILILIPTMLLGATFPLVTKIYHTARKQAGRAVGDVYAMNTAGAILGSFFVGFVLIPGLGIQGSLLLAAILFLLSGFVLFFLSASQRKSRGFVAACALVIVALGGSFGLGRSLESWDPMILSSGLYMLSHEKSLEQIAAKGRLLQTLKKQEQGVKYYKEGLTSTVAVIEQNGIRFLKIGGKTDATTFGDMPTQLLLAHVPMMLHPNPVDALVIGLGGGVTVGSVLTYSSIQKVDLVEVSPEVVEVVRDYGFFDEVNNRPFLDNRLNLIVTDARNHVDLTSSKYDVIISEPSNPWMAGMAMLFTQEHLENCRERLNPGGLICQWLPAYRISKQDFLTVLATFASVFEYVSVWESIPGVDYLFIGSMEPQSIDYKRVTKSLSEIPVQKDLSRLLISDVPTFLSYYLADEKQVQILTREYPVNTDDNVLLEYSAPRNIFNHSARTIPFNEIRQKSEITLKNILSHPNKQNLIDLVKQTRQGRAWTLEAFKRRWQGDRKAVLQALGRALTLNSSDWNGRDLEIKMRMEAVRNSLQLGQFDNALIRLNKIQLLPGQPDSQFNKYKSIAYQGLRKENLKSN
ncbi:fused MFS/spermidine synthase [candidate division KSB1 bacterium]|nr:fused MFS/spermidine synthase [candidate division KSB1 bacterium]